MSYLIQDSPITCIRFESTFDLETQLSNFVRQALKQTCTNQYSSEQAMYLLDQAWWAQKLLWQLRQRNTNS